MARLRTKLVLYRANGLRVGGSRDSSAMRPSDRRSADHLIAEIARSQYGLVSVSQAAACDVSLRQLQRRCDSGQLAAVRRGVLRVAGAPPCWEQAALAAVLAGGDESLVSHGAAGRVWDY
jgi:hypothetical protein